jgi:DNA-binding XRE family transcriptional regulator
VAIDKNRYSLSLDLALQLQLALAFQKSITQVYFKKADPQHKLKVKLRGL